MNTKRQVPVAGLALVVMAAGVVTVSPEFTRETVGDFTPIQLPDTLAGLGDAASGH